MGWGGSIRICHTKSSVFNTFLSRSSNPNLSHLSCWCLKKVTQFAENKIVRHFFCISGADFSVTKSQESGQVFWLSQREGSETVRKWRARCKDEILCAVRTKYFALGAWNVMRTVPTFRRTSKVSSDPTLSDKKRNSYAAAMMDSRLQAGTEGEGAPLMSWKSTIERHTLFLKEWKKESFLFLFNKTIYNYMIRSNWLKDKRMECSFVTKPKQASDKYPPRTGQKTNINDWKRDKYQTDNLGRDKFQRGLRQIPNTNRMSMFNFREFQTLHCSTTNL